MARSLQTTVFTRSTSNGKVTVYVGKQDFVDHLTHIDPVEGVVTVDSNSLPSGGKVFAHILAAFRYGREDMDVMGLHCRKDIFHVCLQVFPRTEEKPLTPLQEQLMRKLGANAYPFLFELPPNMADTVRLTTPAGMKDKQCGVEYELKVYIADNKEDKPQSGGAVRLPIRKLTFAPEEEAPQPKDVVVKHFVFSSGNIRLESSLDKEKYYHGEQIAINALIDNNSNKIIKKIKFSVVQYTSLHLHDDTTTCVELSTTQTTEGFPIDQNQTGVCRVFQVTPSVSHCRHKIGVAVDGSTLYRDTNLASTTVLTKHCQKEQMGIMVSYCIKVRLILGFGTKDLSLELPFTLTYPKAPSKQSSALPGDIVFEEFARPYVDGCGPDADH